MHDRIQIMYPVGETQQTSPRRVVNWEAEVLDRGEHIRNM